MTSSGSRPRVWVTGAGGLIGSYVVRSAAVSAPEFDVIPLTRSALDLLDAKAVQQRFAAERPSMVIHCAALSRSDACQRQPELARALNVSTTAMLAELAGEITFLFFSTDLVFDGAKGNYVENDPVHPLSVYAETKVEAEKVVLSNPRHIVVRTSLNAGESPTGDRGFDEQMRSALQQNQTLRMFVDEFRSPIHASVTARAVWELALSGQNGIFHVAGSERISRWDLAQALATSFRGLPGRVEPASLREYKGAPRPPDTSLNCAKVQALLSFQLPRLTEWMRLHQTAHVHVSTPGK